MSGGQWIYRRLGGRLLQWELILRGKKHKECERNKGEKDQRKAPKKIRSVFLFLTNKNREKAHNPK